MKLNLVDILEVLQMRNCASFEMSFNRANLYYEIRPKTKMVVSDIVEFVQKYYPKSSGIVYCLSRKACESMCDDLQKAGLKCAFYHAGLHKTDRCRIQKDWGEDRIRIIVATVAFGMGIDKADVRFVIHHSLPQSLEGYYQETGRAGRDGKPSKCILLYSYRDKSTVILV
jgi:RecQ family ATP-dependent DNA helicase